MCFEGFAKLKDVSYVICTYSRADTDFFVGEGGKNKLATNVFIDSLILIVKRYLPTGWVYTYLVGEHKVFSKILLLHFRI